MEGFRDRAREAARRALDGRAGRDLKTQRVLTRIARKWEEDAAGAGQASSPSDTGRGGKSR